MRRPLEGEFHPYYEHYINLTEGVDFINSIHLSTQQMVEFIESVPSDKEDYAYEEEKWTIKQLVKHLIDSDLVFIYRAITIARNDKAMLPGYEQNDWAEVVDLTNTNIKELKEEFLALRQFIVSSLGKLKHEDLNRIGNANNSPVTPLSTAFIIAGHTVHHLNVLKERYV